MRIYVVNHPKAEPRYGDIVNGKYRLPVPWNMDLQHHRKYMVRSGRVADLSSNKIIREDQLFFWGEYEPASFWSLFPRGSSLAKAVNDVLIPVGSQYHNIPQVNAAGSCYNTDPYVYGREFYYTCCKRLSNNQYNPNDVVLFGCIRTMPGSGVYDLFDLDTVLVVKEERKITQFDPMSNFYKASIVPLLLSNEPIHSVIVGKTFTERSVPFSFVPSLSNKTLVSKGIGIKPTINLRSIGIQCPKVGRGTILPNNQAGIGEWQKILQAVQGFELAVEFDEVK